MRAPLHVAAALRTRPVLLAVVLTLALLPAGGAGLLLPSTGTWFTDYRAFLANASADAASGDASPPPAASARMHLHWAAPVLSGGGYCSEATSFAFGLLEHGGVALTLEQHGDSVSTEYIQGLPTEDARRLAGLLRAAPPRGGGGGGLISVCHSEPGAWQLSAALPQRYATAPCPRPGARVTVGRTMFETDRTPDGWAARLNAVDEVWVPSSFQRDVFAAGGVDPAKLLVLPEPVDGAAFAPRPLDEADRAALAAAGLPPRTCPPGTRPGTAPGCPFRFLAVGKMERRKGFDVLGTAFLAEFAGGGGGGGDGDKPQHVELVVLTSAYHSSSADFRAALRAALVACPPGTDPAAVAARNATCVFTDGATGASAVAAALAGRVHVLAGVPQALLPAVYAAADAFVLASRGEGWGRPHVEALAAGLPVIATQWSGPSEFLTHANSYPLRHTGLEPIPDGPFAGHRQAAPDPAHLRQLMAAVVASVAGGDGAAAARGAAGRADMLALYAPPQLARFVAHQVARISAAVAEADAAGGRRRRAGEL